MIEFIKFGNAVSVNGVNLNSANNKDFNIHQVNDFVFSVASKRAPTKETFVAVTNVSEWRNEAVAKAKSKANS